MSFPIKYKHDYPEYTESSELFMDVIRNANCHSIAEENNFLSTGQVLFYLAFQINRICDTILLRFVGDYPLAILYRSLIEHSVKHFYIFARFNKEKNDAVGEQYYFDCIYDEQVKKMNAILWPNFIKVKQDKKSKHKQIKKKADQFTFRNILNYMAAIDVPDLPDDFTRFIKQLKSDYNLCSSYTHGGPEAISMTKQIPQKNIQHSSVAISIIAQLNTINAFSKFDSKSKTKLIKIAQAMNGHFEGILSKWETVLNEETHH